MTESDIKDLAKAVQEHLGRLLRLPLDLGVAYLDHAATPFSESDILVNYAVAQSKQVVGVVNSQLVEDLVAEIPDLRDGGRGRLVEEIGIELQNVLRLVLNSDAEPEVRGKPLVAKSDVTYFVLPFYVQNAVLLKVAVQL